MARWRTAPALVLENIQTGDGRVMAEGAIEWAELPLPLAWLRDGDQHVSLTEVGPQIGTIDLIRRDANGVIYAEGEIDENNVDGAEVVRRMNEGTAPLGNRFPVSIDPDNWDVEIIATDVAEADDIAEADMMLQASGNGALPHFSRSAAAGDPDPAESVLLFEDSVDEILERYTRLRIRGATLCSVAAFDQAAIELVSEAAATASTPAAPAAATAAVTIPAAPPADWFRLAEPEIGDERLVEQVDGSWACPLTITDDGQVFGHLARRDQAHRGYTRRTTPPTSSTGYREFHVGAVQCADGTTVAVGPLVVGCDHAPDGLTADGARDHYANSGLGFADVRVIDGRLGPWMCGALRPGITDSDVRVLRALSPSGDWRGPDVFHLELISVLAVNAPGFPIARERLAASAMSMVAAAPAAPRVGIQDGQVVSLVAAGVVRRCSECAERERLAAAMGSADEVIALLTQLRREFRTLERRTRHLEVPAVEALAARLHVA